MKKEINKRYLISELKNLKKYFFENNSSNFSAQYLTEVSKQVEELKRLKKEYNLESTKIDSLFKEIEDHLLNRSTLSSFKNIKNIKIEGLSGMTIGIGVFLILLTSVFWKVLEKDNTYLEQKVERLEKENNDLSKKTLTMSYEREFREKFGKNYQVKHYTEVAAGDIVACPYNGKPLAKVKRNLLEGMIISSDIFEAINPTFYNISSGQKIKQNNCSLFIGHTKRYMLIKEPIKGTLSIKQMRELNKMMIETENWYKKHVQESSSEYQNNLDTITQLEQMETIRKVFESANELNKLSNEN